MTPLRVLLIEDDHDDHELLAELLAGHDITWFDRPEPGVDALLHGTYDVALVDFRLGTMTAVEVLERIRGNPDVPPCIVLTGSDDPERDREAAEAGAVDFLDKESITDRQLERAIRYATANHRAVRSLRESEFRFRSVIEAAKDAIALVNSEGRVLIANRAAHEIFGFEQRTLIGTDFTACLSGVTLERLFQGFDDPHADAGTEFEVSRSGRRADGSVFPIELSTARWVEHGEDRLSIVVRDVSTQKHLIDKLSYEAFHDRLTGLANRALVRQRIGQVVTRLVGADRVPALLLIDLDDFKRINDVEGHEVGDDLLRLVARRLQSCVRQGETVARFGGDEFAVLVESLDAADDVVRLAERISASLAEPFRLAGSFTTITASIGVALIDTIDSDADEVIRNADVAMYAAKAHGRNRVELFQTEMHGSILNRIALESDLRAAIESDQIDLHYQPLIDLATGRTTGFEALARWTHPERGFVSPLTFVEAAERSGMIGDLGRLVLRKAVRQAADWQRLLGPSQPISIAVNVSSEQLEDPGLVRFVAGLLADTGLENGSLTLEITESVMMGDVEAAIGTLTALRELGLKLAMDDFGTGYSSLSYLRRLPIDIVKLDRAFVNDATDERGRSLVAAVAGLATSLGLMSVAEGIEDDDQRRMLTEFGFDRGQGYFFAKPLPPAEAVLHLVEPAPVATPSEIG